MNLDIYIKGSMFIYKLFDKRDSLPFSIVIILYKESKIPWYIFYSAIKRQVLRFAWSTLCLNDFISKAKELLTRMKLQGSKTISLLNIHKISCHHPHSFQHIFIQCDNLIDVLSSNNQYFLLCLCLVVPVAVWHIWKTVNVLYFAYNRGSCI